MVIHRAKCRHLSLETHNANISLLIPKDYRRLDLLESILAGVVLPKPSRPLSSISTCQGNTLDYYDWIYFGKILPIIASHGTKTPLIRWCLYRSTLVNGDGSRGMLIHGMQIFSSQQLNDGS